MEFIVGLPLMSRRHDSIFVVVDTLKKISHFIPVQIMYQAPDIARIFINKIVRLHGVLKNIILDRGAIFAGRFWISFQDALGSQLNFSATCYSKTNGQTKFWKTC
jgi:hypothetical protein